MSIFQCRLCDRERKFLSIGLRSKSFSFEDPTIPEGNIRYRTGVETEVNIKYKKKTRIG